MKKYIISLVLALSAVFSAYAATISSTATFESDYVFRGLKTGENVAGTDVVIALPSKTELAVLGLWNTSDFKTTAREFDVSLSKGFAIDKAATFKVAAVGYIYPKADSKIGESDFTVELLGSLVYDTFLNPTVTAGYDINLEQIFGEASLSQPISLGFLTKGLKLVPTVSVGFVGTQNLLPEKSGSPVKDSYHYLTGKLDLIYDANYLVVGVGYRQNHLNNSFTDNSNWVGGFATIRF